MSNLTVVTISLEISRRLRVNPQGLLEGELSPVDKYANRQEWHNTNRFPGQRIMDMNINDFVCHIDLFKGKLRSNPNDIVVRVIQQYSSNPSNPTYPLFCKFRVLQFKPWIERPENAFLPYPNDEGGWVNAWRDFLDSIPSEVLLLQLFCIILKIEFIILFMILFNSLFGV